MELELQNCIDLSARAAFDRRETIDVPRIENKWFLADSIRPPSKGKTDVSVMQVIRRADANVLNYLPLPPAAVKVAIKTLKLDEKSRIWKIAVYNADGIGRVEGGS